MRPFVRGVSDLRDSTSLVFATTDFVRAGGIAEFQEEEGIDASVIEEDVTIRIWMNLD